MDSSGKIWFYQNPCGGLRRFISPLAAAAFALLMILAAASCTRDTDPKNRMILRVGAPALEQNALIYIAMEKGFFSKNDVSVVMKDYDSGLTALDAMLKGEVDIAGTPEFPVVTAIIRKENIRIIACNDRFENDYIVWRTDRGIRRVSDLRKKRIGLTAGTINEFYLGRFLALNGLAIQDVFIVNLKPAEYMEAIAGGRIDALVAWQPHVHRVGREIGQSVMWPVQNSQAAYGLLTCREQWLRGHADAVSRFLKSLKEAADYLVNHPGEAKEIVRKRLDYEASYMEQIWPYHHFALSLDQTLIIAMKDEAQWFIENHDTAAKTIPDFTSYIYTDGLGKIEPDAINIIQ